MRILGFLFLVLIALGLFGWFRGWFSVTTARAGESVTVHVDEGRIREDSRAAADKIADTSDQVAKIVKSIGRRTHDGETIVRGTVTAIDAVERDLTVRVDDAASDTPSLRLRIPSTLSITRDSGTVYWDDLRIGSRVKLTFATAGDDRQLSHVELLP